MKNFCQVQAGLLLLLQLLMAMGQDFQPAMPCFTKIPFDSSRFKPKYKIGVLAIRGAEAAYSQYNATFTEYLSEVAGKRFDPPIEFEMVDVGFQSIHELLDAGELDFLFVNPSKASCIESMIGTQPLASIIVSTTVDGEEMKMSEFAGLIITQAGNENINTIQDLTNKTVAAISIAGFGSGLMQFYEMQKNGMSYINDPAELVFTGDQGDVVRGVLDGIFDAGFVRTGLIERTVDRDGNLVDPSKIKIIDSRKDSTASGLIFPYEHSTPLYPEWSFVAIKTTPFEVSREVQAALLAVARHGTTGTLLDTCLQAKDSVNITGAQCADDLIALDPQASCDISPETALSAFKALSNGGYAGWRTTLAYNGVQKVLYDTGHLFRDPVTQEWGCVPSTNLYEKLNCPDGFFKLPKDIFRTACEKVGLDCPEGSECVCRPCFEAFPVEVAPQAVYEPGKGCKKMDICGRLAQNDVLNFTIADNLELPEGLDLRVIVLEGDAEREISVVPGPNPNQYTLPLSSTRAGLLVLEIFDGDEQIDASPLRVKVGYRTCPNKQTATEDGGCRCVDTAYSIAGRCFESRVVAVFITIPIVVILATALFFYIRRKRREADSIWMVKSSELEFGNPPKAIGEGTFGYILLAEYRGSKVAVKKVLPPKKDGSSRRSPTDNEEMEQTLDLEKGLDPTAKTKPPSLTSSSTDTKSLDMGGESDSHKKMSVTFSNKVDFVNSDSGDETSIASSKNTKALPWAKRSLMKTKKGSPTSMRNEFMREMRLLSQLRHPNITTVMGAVVERGVQPMMIMEYMEHGSLQELLSNPSIMLEADMIHGILQDIAQGVRFLHSSHPPVIHGDLKSDNVLIDSKFRAKLSDFGLSHCNIKRATGTPLWMAPELLTGKSLNTRESDMYSVGIMMNEIFSRQEPFSEALNESSEALIAAITDKRSRRPVVPAHCPIKAKKLLQFLWHADPRLRPSASELDNRLQEMDADVFEPFEEAAHSHRRKEKVHQGDHSNFLYQAFPKHVAGVLAAGDKVEPESHEVVTIFFSDIVGFTTIASRFEPLKVSQMLDRLYHKFDDLARKHQLFKIETIGDAYMCAGNLATDQKSDHAKRIALFAKDAIHAASETLIDEENPAGGCINIRVGFHSGPVVSNVVGNLNPRYGVFGDTVNVASRMESSSEMGKIHCSRSSAKLLMKQAPELVLELRGETAIKGKGKMTTYWVN